MKQIDAGVAAIAPERLAARLRAGDGELALLDVREEGAFGDGHIIVASSLPLSRLETGIAVLVPRKTTAIVVYDDDGGARGLAERARTQLAMLGYPNVAVLQGGLAGWRIAGGAIYDGLNTPSKALGVFVHRELAIPEVDAAELATMLAAGDVAVLDCRPFAEYRNGCIPGASSCPGAMLTTNAMHALQDKQHLAINCAGRTRGLIGAQSLIDAGFDASRIIALRDGTMGWQLSGHAVEKGASRSALATPPRRATPEALERAAAIRDLAGIGLIDAKALAALQSETDRTCYLIDIREKRDFDAGHIAGARHVAGGQLVQNLDMHAATHGARIVVSDEDSVAATGVALWLKRMGWEEVFVAPLDDDGFAVETGPDRLPPGPTAKAITADALHSLLDRKEAIVVDLANSREYRRGHIPGAYFIVRSRLAEWLPRLPPAKTLVLTSEDGRLAAFAAHDETGYSGTILVLDGGTAEWVRAGYPLARDTAGLIDKPDDVVLKPSELAEGPEREEAMRVYLGGSEELLAKVEREGILRFRTLLIIGGG